MDTPSQIDRLNTALDGRYDVRREIGRGGMATVYLAREAAMDRDVALKVFDPGLSGAVGRKRFVREVELVARLSHPNIIPIFAAGEADGLLYYVMPFIDGSTIRHRLTRSGRMGTDETIAIATEIAGALAHAHEHGVVHRDIKPENILLMEGRPAIADFGIAKALLTAGGETLTRTGLVIGTARYMSPEQAAGTVVDGRTDVYALGRMMYEMLAGDVPGDTGTNMTLVPPAIRPALGRAIARDAGARFQTAHDLEAALRGIGPQSVQTARLATARQLKVAVGILAVTLIAAAVLSALLRSGAP